MDRTPIQRTTQASQSYQQSNSYTEVIEYIQKIYAEYCQNKPSFNQFACIFCKNVYAQLRFLLTHIEGYHKSQILDGSFKLQRNFEKLISANAEPAEGIYNKMDQTIGQLYQCAKCYVTFERVEDISHHLTECAMDNVYQQHPIQHHAQHQQQQVPVPAPVIQPTREDIYGCARCGSKFCLVRELVLHLHMCVIDTFHDKDQYLTPNLWVQAPDGQHIVINETETNTTLNTAGLWLMSNDGVASADIVSKGFWVMPPPNNHDIPLMTVNPLAVKAEPVLPIQQPRPPVPPPPQQQQHQQQPVIVMPSYEQYVDTGSVSALANRNQTVDGKYVQMENGTWMESSAKKSKTIADENKRKRGRAKVISTPVKSKKNHFVASAPYVISQAQQSTAPQTKFVYINKDTNQVLNETSVGANNRANKKRYEIPSTTTITKHYLDPSVEIVNLNDPIDNYILSTYENGPSPLQIIPKEEIVYEESADYIYNVDGSNHMIIQQQQQELENGQNQELPGPAKQQLNVDPNLDDLSHLDTPIFDAPIISTPIKSRKADYIESYCSFLKSRTISNNNVK